MQICEITAAVADLKLPSVSTPKRGMNVTQEFIFFKKKWLSFRAMQALDLFHFTEVWYNANYFMRTNHAR